MPATATQTAQKPTPKQQQTPKNQSSKGKQEQSKGLAALSQKAGIAAMAVLLILSLFVGNFRALQPCNAEGVHPPRATCSPLWRIASVPPTTS